MIREFHVPENIEQAILLKSQGAHYLAGGTQINSRRTYLEKDGFLPDDGLVGNPGMGEERDVIYLEGLNLKGIHKEGDFLIIGSCVTLQSLIDSEIVPPALQQAAGFIPTRSIRNMATIGGNIGAGRSDSYLIPALIALGAEVECAPPGYIPVEDYVSEEMDSLIISVKLPLSGPVCDVVKESRSHLAYPVVSAAVSLDSSGKIIIAAGCVAKHTLRLTSVENALNSGEISDKEAIEKAVSEAIDPREDFLGSVEYKKQVNAVKIAESVLKCREALK